MTLIRWILGRIVLTIDFFTTPKGLKRALDEQHEINIQTTKLALYQFSACPFCVKVRRSMKRLSLDIELRDAKKNQHHRSELEQQGGRIKTPCLRIENPAGDVTWMYESSDIIRYLEQRFSAKTA
jgi:glutaredoxin